MILLYWRRKAKRDSCYKTCLWASSAKIIHQCLHKNALYH